MTHPSRTPQGVRGLKSNGYAADERFLSRTPQGVRGLKLRLLGGHVGGDGSHPARGAWIEIDDPLACRPAVHVAPRKGCVD